MAPAHKPQKSGNFAAVPTEDSPRVGSPSSGRWDLRSSGAGAVGSFSPRSLVGMSQSARKRAARVDCMGGEVKHELPRRIWMMWWRIHRRDGSNPAEPESYQADRAKYRIGQRLRPCPGCPACDEPRSSVRQLRGWVRLAGLRLFSWKRIATEPCNGFTGRWFAGWTVHLRTGERIGGAWRDDDLRAAWETAAQHCLNGLRKALGSAPRCDGSGVLPAKRIAGGR